MSNKPIIDIVTRLNSMDDQRVMDSQDFDKILYIRSELITFYQMACRSKHDKLAASLMAAINHIDETYF